jgi:hypothetical protein
MHGKRHFNQRPSWQDRQVRVGRQTAARGSRFSTSRWTSLLFQQPTFVNYRLSQFILFHVVQTTDIGSIL